LQNKREKNGRESESGRYSTDAESRGGIKTNEREEEEWIQGGMCGQGGELLAF
jgi:hypothetical protein